MVAKSRAMKKARQLPIDPAEVNAEPIIARGGKKSKPRQAATAEKKYLNVVEIKKPSAGDKKDKTRPENVLDMFWSMILDEDVYSDDGTTKQPLPLPPRQAVTRQGAAREHHKKTEHEKQLPPATSLGRKSRSRSTSRRPNRRSSSTPRNGEAAETEIMTYFLGDGGSEDEAHESKRHIRRRRRKSRGASNDARARTSAKNSSKKITEDTNNSIYSSDGSDTSITGGRANCMVFEGNAWYKSRQNMQLALESTEAGLSAAAKVLGQGATSCATTAAGALEGAKQQSAQESLDLLKWWKSGANLNCLSPQRELIEAQTWWKPEALPSCTALPPQYKCGGNEDEVRQEQVSSSRSRPPSRSGGRRVSSSKSRPAPAPETSVRTPPPPMWAAQTRKQHQTAESESRDQPETLIVIEDGAWDPPRCLTRDESDVSASELLINLDGNPYQTRVDMPRGSSKQNKKRGNHIAETISSSNEKKIPPSKEQHVSPGQKDLQTMPSDLCVPTFGSNGVNLAHQEQTASRSSKTPSPQPGSWGGTKPPMTPVSTPPRPDGDFLWIPRQQRDRAHSDTHVSNYLPETTGQGNNRESNSREVEVNKKASPVEEHVVTPVSSNKTAPSQVKSKFEEHVVTPVSSNINGPPQMNRQIMTWYELEREWNVHRHQENPSEQVAPESNDQLGGGPQDLPKAADRVVAGTRDVPRRRLTRLEEIQARRRRYTRPRDAVGSGAPSPEVRDAGHSRGSVSSSVPNMGFKATESARQESHDEQSMCSDRSIMGDKRIKRILERRGALRANRPASRVKGDERGNQSNRAGQGPPSPEFHRAARHRRAVPTKEDDTSGNQADLERKMAASMKLEIGARVARLQNEKLEKGFREKRATLSSVHTRPSGM